MLIIEATIQPSDFESAKDALKRIGVDCTMMSDATLRPYNEST